VELWTGGHFFGVRTAWPRMQNKWLFEAPARRYLRIAARLQSCGLELHPEKTKIVYCKDDSRKKTYPNEKFDFLGYSVLQKHTDKEFIMN